MAILITLALSFFLSLLSPSFPFSVECFLTCFLYLPVHATLLFSVRVSLHSFPVFCLPTTVFRRRWFFITQPCFFSRAGAQKQCVRGWAWFCTLISCSQAKGWVTYKMHASFRLKCGNPLQSQLMLNNRINRIIKSKTQVNR